MLASLLFAAAAGALAPPQAPAELIAPERIPAAGEPSGAVLVDVFTDPQGYPLNCAVEQVFEKDFGALVCGAVYANRFTPATDSSGKPAYGLFRQVFNFAAPGTQGTVRYPVSKTPELFLAVKPVRGLLTERRDVELAVLIDAAGRIAECVAGKAGDPAQLVAAACAQAKADWSDAPLEDPQDKPRDYVRALTVAFVPES